ncbi:hypothetical protein K7X08_031448 [Anisodus acutangulus]|uniref:Uncharacterized protein n=1 Tax=Anisodus acutangulus TaxID=402998 RepID=A0A9Q1MLN8_9SOLA|nr:hypothetical protein K7X08_031448 [Anisodus acutangulus]
MLQTYMERKSKLEEERKILLQYILANGEALKRANELLEEVNSSSAMNLLTPQYELVEEETSSSRDEPKFFYGHDESQENEEVIQIEEENCFEKEVSSSQKEEIEEILILNLNPPIHTNHTLSYRRCLYILFYLKKVEK